MAHLRALDETLQRSGGRLLVRSGAPTTVVPAITESLRAELLCSNADVTPYARRRDQAVADADRRVVRAMVGQSGPPSGIDTHSQRTGLTGLHPVRHQVEQHGAAHVAPERAGRPRQRSRRRRSRVRGSTLSTWGRRSGVASIPRVRAARRRVRRHQGHPGGGRHVPALRRPALRRTGAGRRGRGDRHGDQRPGFLRPPAGVARLVRASAVGVAIAGRQQPYGPSSTASHGRTIRTTSWRGKKAAPAFPSLTQACASWRPRAGCTTGSAWSPPPSSSRIFWWTGGSASDGSGDSWSTRTSPRTRGTGNGWPEPAPMPRRISGSSIPVAQSGKFDPDGAYIRAFVPELAHVPAPWIHAPWTAPPMELASCGRDTGGFLPPSDHRPRLRPRSRHRRVQSGANGLTDPSRLKATGSKHCTQVEVRPSALVR